MPISREDEFALGDAETIANDVVMAAIKYGDQLVAFEGFRKPYLDTIIAQHVKVQLAVLHNRWSSVKDEKVASALQDMGTGISLLSEVSRKKSLHVKLES